MHVTSEVQQGQSHVAFRVAANPGLHSHLDDPGPEVTLWTAHCLQAQRVGKNPKRDAWTVLAHYQGSVSPTLTAQRGIPVNAPWDSKAQTVP